MATTTTHGLPVPQTTDTPNVPRDIGNLGTSLDTQLLTTVTSLPGSPVDGQRCLYLADATNGVVWDLRYRSASGSAYKWEFVGGGILENEVANSDAHASSLTFIDFAHVGPSLTIPLAGEYVFDLAADMFNTANQLAYAALQFGATVPTGVADGFRWGGSSSPAAFSGLARRLKRTVSTAGQTVKMVYADSGGAATVSNRSLAATPVRVG